jgi:hypothetical protein
MPMIYRTDNVIVPLCVVIFTLLLFYWVVKRKIADETSLTTWQPKVPNYLQVLTGEEKPKRGLRYRTTFWSDLLLVGVGLCAFQAYIYAYYFFDHIGIPNVPSIQYSYLTVVAISFVAYLLFAILFAGVPRKRYYGYIYLGLFLGVFDATCLFCFEPWLYQYLVKYGNVPTPVFIGYTTLTFALFWLLCFVLSGIAGLHAFRRSNNSV